MTKMQKVLAIAGAVLLIAIVAVFFLQRPQTPVPESDVSQKPSAPESPLVRFPVPDQPVSATVEEPPLPRLEQSDEALQKEFDTLMDRQKFGSLFVLNEIINRVVVSIDNLTQRNVPWKQLIFNSTPGEFQAKKIGLTHLALDPKNYKRYEMFVQMVDAIDAKKSVAVYFKYYALFQESYINLGYPKKYFNDRVISTIDHLLDTPDVQGEIALKQPSVHYIYADPKLEALSSGQKILIRMGGANAAKIKAKLREFRQEIVAQMKP
jgi:hypothetical protein